LAAKEGGNLVVRTIDISEARDGSWLAHDERPPSMSDAVNEYEERREKGGVDPGSLGARANALRAPADRAPPIRVSHRNSELGSMNSLFASFLDFASSVDMVAPSVDGTTGVGSCAGLLGA
jgi:hypothetical protein